MPVRKRPIRPDDPGGASPAGQEAGARAPEEVPMQWFIVEAANKPGEFARHASAIAQRGVNLANVVSLGIGDRGGLAFFATDEAGVRSALNDAGIAFREVSAVSARDRRQAGRHRRCGQAARRRRREHRADRADGDGRPEVHRRLRCRQSRARRLPRWATWWRRRRARPHRPRPEAAVSDRRTVPRHLLPGRGAVRSMRRSPPPSAWRTTLSRWSAQPSPLPLQPQPQSTIRFPAGSMRATATCLGSWARPTLSMRRRAAR